MVKNYISNMLKPFLHNNATSQDKDASVRAKLHMLPFLAVENFDTSYEFATRIGDILRSGPEASIICSFVSVLNNEQENDNIKFCAFYGLSIIYRRLKKLKEWGDLIDSWRVVFRDKFQFFEYIDFLYFIESSQENIDEKMKKSYEMVEKFPDNLGVASAFGRILLDCCDMEKDDGLRQEMLDKHLSIALKLIEKAKAGNRNYAKYYYIEGRLLAYMGQYDEALKKIKRAWDMMSSSEPESLYWRIDYQYHYIEVQRLQTASAISKSQEKLNELLEKEKRNLGEFFIQKIEELNTRIAEQKAELEKINRRNIEYLVFFAAIMSFTVGSLNIAAKSEHSGITLIIVLLLSLIITYGLFSLFIREETTSVTVSAIIVAIALLVFIAFIMPTPIYSGFIGFLGAFFK